MIARRMQRLEFWLLNAIGLAIGLVLATAVWLLMRDDPYDPLSYEPQVVEDLVDGVTVVPEVDGFDGPAVRLGATVPVAGIRCVDDDHPVDVVGSMWWVRVDRPGTRVQVVDDVPRELIPGCELLRFDNAIPVEVMRIVDEAGVPQVWRISGSVTPTAPGGVTETWQTEPFTLVP